MAAKRRTPTDNGQILQRAREDAGLSREELGYRLTLAEAVSRALHVNANGYSAEQVQRWAVRSGERIRKLERSRISGPDQATLSILLTVIDAGEPGTADSVIVDCCVEFRDARQIAQHRRAIDEGRALARTIMLNADDPRSLERLVKTEIEAALKTKTIDFFDPDYAPGTGVRKLQSAFLALAAELEKVAA